MSGTVVCPRHTGSRSGECLHGISGGAAFQSLACKLLTADNNSATAQKEN